MTKTKDLNKAVESPKIQTIIDISKILGLELDEWQARVIYQTIRLKKYYLSGPRQIGKTTLAVMASIILAMRGSRVIFLAHRQDNVLDLLNITARHCQPLKQQGIVTDIRNGRNQQEIVFASGGFIKFRVRSPGVSVGMTFDAIVWDEAQKIDPAIVEEVNPTLRMARNPIQLFIGTPPLREEVEKYPDGPFIQAKKRGGLQYKEYSFAEQYSADLDIRDLKRSRAANPAWRRTPDFWEGMKSAQQDMSHEDYCRQYLGVWNLPKKAEAVKSLWNAHDMRYYTTKKGSSAQFFDAGVGIMPNSETAYITMNDGVIAEVAHRVNLREEGIDGVFDWLAERLPSIRTISIPRNAQGRTLASLFDDRKLSKRYQLVDMPTLGNKITRFKNQVESNQLMIYSANDVDIALTSFWLGINKHFGDHEIRTNIPEDHALLLSIVNTVTNKTSTERIAGTKIFVF